MIYFYIFLGGGFGAVARFLLAGFVGKLFAATVFGTMFVNVFGSFLMGLLVGYFLRENSFVNFFLAVGFLGGFTTFSAFSLDFLNLWLKGEYVFAFAYVLLSVIFSLLAIFFGFYLTRQL